MHDVIIVTSQGSGGRHITRTVYAASDDDARQTHQENYAGEPIVEVSPMKPSRLPTFGGGDVTSIRSGGREGGQR
jgi:hypothetical protein